MKVEKVSLNMRANLKVGLINKQLVFIILLILVLILGGCSNQTPGHSPKAKEGILELNHLEIENNVIKLDGEWEFYWNKLIDPNDIDSDSMNGYISVPSSWNKLEVNDEHSGYGYATYRLQFITSKDKKLAIKIPRIFTAYNLWINGELIASAGEVGKSREVMTPQYLPQIGLFESQDGKNEIIIQVSNFYHRSGGILESINLGGEKQIVDLRYKSLAREFILFGSLISIGTYHMALYFFRKKNKSSLYFGLFCLFVSIRTLLVGERFLIHLIPTFSWEIAHKLQTLTYYLGVPFILMFFKSIYSEYFHNRIIMIANIVGIVFSFLVLFTPARIFTIFNPIYQIWTMIAIIYILAKLMILGIRKEAGSLFIIMGAIALLLSSANDLIFHNIWMNDNGPQLLRTVIRTGNLSSLGQFIFAFLNSLLLAKTFSNSLEQKEILTAELTDINTNLDQIVLQRTEELVSSNEKIEQQKMELENVNRQLQNLSVIDPLTKLWNRRKYDETLKLEWNRCLRYQRSISLIILDIDNFKAYNDFHGHIAGDECLTIIGDTIRQSLLRASDMPSRYGGEEFIVILPETEKEEAIRTADLIRHKIENLKIIHGQSSVSGYVTVSIGVTSTIPNNDISADDLLKEADKALYQAKNDGRNKVKFLPIQ